jgi:hypothetical protein
MICLYQPESHQAGPAPAENLPCDKQPTDSTAILLSCSLLHHPESSEPRTCVTNHDCQIEFRPPLHQRPESEHNNYIPYERTSKITIISLKISPFRSVDILLADTSVTSIAGRDGERLRPETAKRPWPSLEGHPFEDTGPLISCLMTRQEPCGGSGRVHARERRGTNTKKLFWEGGASVESCMETLGTICDWLGPSTLAPRRTLHDTWALHGRSLSFHAKNSASRLTIWPSLSVTWHQPSMQRISHRLLQSCQKPMVAWAGTYCTLHRIRTMNEGTSTR